MTLSNSVWFALDSPYSTVESISPQPNLVPKEKEFAAHGPSLHVATPVIAYTVSAGVIGRGDLQLETARCYTVSVMFLPDRRTPTRKRSTQIRVGWRCCFYRLSQRLSWGVSGVSTTIPLRLS